MEDENYLNNFEKFVDQFQTEKVCIEYNSLLRWPDGYKCPHGESSKAWITWLRGTHQGAISSSHLQDYLDEYAFRFNRRLSTPRGKLFYRLMQQAVNNRAPGIKELYKI